MPCTGDSTAFSQTNPLWIADYVNDPSVLFGGWGFRTFWQYTSSPLDQNQFNGAYDRLQALALAEFPLRSWWHVDRNLRPAVARLGTRQLRLRRRGGSRA